MPKGKKKDSKSSSQDKVSISPQKGKKNKNKSEGSKPKETNSNYTIFNATILEQHDHFKKYITKDPKVNTRFICASCKSYAKGSFSGYYDNLATHIGSENHYDSLEDQGEKDEIIDAVIAFNNFRSRKNKRNYKVLQVTMRDMRFDFTSFLLQNELSFTLAPVLVEFVKNSIEKYSKEALSSLSLSNVYANQIAKEVISPFLKEGIFKDLENTYFALSFDESSDKLGPSYLCTHVRYIKDDEVQNKLLSLNEIKQSATGEYLYNMVLEEIFCGEKRNYLAKNLVGVCTDRGANMLSSKEKGLANRFKAQYKHIITAYDFSHCFNLIAKNCLKHFPQAVLDFIQDICSHFSHSQLRKIQFRECQLNVVEPPDLREVLRYTKTRWTSLLRSTERIKKLWFSLENYYEKYPDKDISPLFKTETQVYISLLCCLLKKINAHIQFFEKDSHSYSMIMPKLKETFIMCCRFIIKEKSFGSDPSFDAQFLALKSLPFDNQVKLKNHLKSDREFKDYFTDKYEEFRNSSGILSRQFMQKLFSTAKSFMTEFVCQMRLRLPFNDDFLSSCEALKLKTLDKKLWQILASRLNPILDSQGIIDELEIAEFHFDDLQQSLRSYGDNQIKFWKNQSIEYPTMSKISLAVLTLPYSTVSVERTFSMLKDIRDPRRNRLSTEGTEACLLGHQQLGSISNLSNNAEINFRMINIWKSSETKVLGNENEIEEEKVNEIENEGENIMEILSSKPQEDEEASENKEEEILEEPSEPIEGVSGKKRLRKLAGIPREIKDELPQKRGVKKE